MNRNGPTPWLARLVQPRGLSRREFLGGAAGTAATSVALGSGMLHPVIAAAGAFSDVDPTAIPNGDRETHHFLPGRGKEISTVNNFDGFAGVGQVIGAGTATDTTTGATTRLNFSVDNRFLLGEFVGVDGTVHRGAFGVFWLDLWTGPVGQGHIHDFAPGVVPSGPSSGLFWTAHVPPESIEIELGRVRASFRLTNFAIPDIISTPPGGASISMSMEWQRETAALQVKDFVNGYAGQYHECQCTIGWSAQEAGFRFDSDLAATSTTRFAELGRERNGLFFKQGVE